MNVIIVDWGHGSGAPYTQATANTRVVGAAVAKLIKQLVAAGANLAKIHLIGHSLGAHIAGYAGERLSQAGGVGRITGNSLVYLCNWCCRRKPGYAPLY